MISQLITLSMISFYLKAFVNENIFHMIARPIFLNIDNDSYLILLLPL